MGDFKNYDPSLVAVSFAGIPIQGYMDGTFVSIEREVETFTKHTGAGGDTTRVRSRNKSGTVTVTLQAASASNALLSAQHTLDELTGLGTGALLVKNINSTETYEASNAWIEKPPTVEAADTASGREWVIACADLTMIVGSAIV